MNSKYLFRFNPTLFASIIAIFLLCAIFSPSYNVNSLRIDDKFETTRLFEHLFYEDIHAIAKIYYKSGLKYMTVLFRIAGVVYEGLTYMLIQDNNVLHLVPAFRDYDLKAMRGFLTVVKDDVPEYFGYTNLDSFESNGKEPKNNNKTKQNVRNNSPTKNRNMMQQRPMGMQNINSMYQNAAGSANNPTIDINSTRLLESYENGSNNGKPATLVTRPLQSALPNAVQNLPMPNLGPSASAVTPPSNIAAATQPLAAPAAKSSITWTDPKNRQGNIKHTPPSGEKFGEKHAAINTDIYHQLKNTLPLTHFENLHVQIGDENPVYAKVVDPHHGEPQDLVVSQDVFTQMGYHPDAGVVNNQNWKIVVKDKNA